MCNITGMPRPVLSALLELLTPITWLPPLWASGFGIAASGAATEGRRLQAEHRLRHRAGQAGGVRRVSLAILLQVTPVIGEVT